MLLHFSYLELSVEGVSIAVSGEDDIVHGWIICRDGGTERGILCRVSPSLVLTDSPSLPPQPAEAHPPTLSQKCLPSGDHPASVEMFTKDLCSAPDILIGRDRVICNL